jgi:hypothetical protein
LITTTVQSTLLLDLWQMGVHRHPKQHSLDEAISHPELLHRVF